MEPVGTQRASSKDSNESFFCKDKSICMLVLYLSTPKKNYLLLLESFLQASSVPLCFSSSIPNKLDLLMLVMHTFIFTKKLLLESLLEAR